MRDGEKGQGEFEGSSQEINFRRVIRQVEGEQGGTVPVKGIGNEQTS
jgi:hypothetical protein